MGEDRDHGHGHGDDDQGPVETVLQETADQAGADHAGDADPQQDEGQRRDIDLRYGLEESRIAVENIELTLQFVVAGRGVAVLPDRLVREVASDMPVASSRIGTSGLHESINVGLRSDLETDYLTGFVDIARRVTP